MSATNYKDPKVYIPAIVTLVLALGAGSIFGFTVEPEEMTALRVENATLKERTSNLESQLSSLVSRVAMLEAIADRCNRNFSSSKSLTEETN